MGASPDDLRALETIPTTTPAATIERAAAFLEREGPVAALGIGSFGPVDTDPASETWGFVTTTPKPGWANADVGQELRRRLGIPVALETDVGAAAVGEHRLGAAQGLETFLYLTVGTGIGGGVFANGRLLRGHGHPEVGHMRVPHDRARDPFEGVCPYHGDCLEGLACGPALERRWGTSPAALDDERAWALEAEYLGLALANVICTLAPQRIVVGGGVMRRTGLYERVRACVRDALGGYLELPDLRGYVVAPGLGDRAGVVGALQLARDVAHSAPAEE